MHLKTKTSVSVFPNHCVQAAGRFRQLHTTTAGGRSVWWLKVNTCQRIPFENLLEMISTGEELGHCFQTYLLFLSETTITKYMGTTCLCRFRTLRWQIRSASPLIIHLTPGSTTTKGTFRLVFF